MSLLQNANLAGRFILELCALAALAAWGISAGAGLPLKIALGAGAPLLAAVAWGTFVAPKAAAPIADAPRLGIELIVFGAAATGLVAAGHPRLAAALALAYGINRALLYVWGQ